MTNVILFIVFPYLAMIVAVIVGVQRYFSDRFTYSSLSSQFLENRQLFWGSVPWHYGIILILLAHIVVAIFPGTWGVILGKPARLYILEITGIGLGLFTILGLVLLVIRRVTNPRIFVVSSPMDFVLLLVLLLQVIVGVSIAIFYRWGGIWYLHTAVPYLISLAKFNPQIDTITNLPFMVKLHIINAWVVVLILPFTRLVHIFTVPLSYLWRPYQVVIWNKRVG